MVDDKPKIIFVYNANSGILNGVSDYFKKNFSPKTYPCNLCAVTYNNFGMKREWKDFVFNLDYSIEFLHKNEFDSNYNLKNNKFPSVYLKKNNEIKLFLSSEKLNKIKSLEELIKIIKEKI